jgi:hypothetical protein
MRLAIALALSGAAMGSLAEQEPHDLPGLDPSKLAPVSSPNRSAPASLAAGFAPAVLGAGRGREDRDSGPARAIVWVDATGKTVGRAVGQWTIFTTYNNEPAVIIGLEPDRQCNLGIGSCTYLSGGIAWPRTFRVSLYYGTTDCTGAPYLYSSPGLGTSMIGVALVDDGAQYIYFSRITDTARILVRSVLASPALGGQGTCYSAGQFADLTPVINVLPGSALGTAPFMLK